LDAGRWNSEDQEIDGMKKIKILIIVIVLVSVQMLLGVIPRNWEFYKMDDYLDGKFDGISVSHEGMLSLSPKEEAIEGPTEEFYLSLLLASGETMYLGTGHSGKIYRIQADGKVELYFQAPEMDVYCLAQDEKGNLYAGTSPNGKIYKITRQGEGEPYFNPTEKYIWDLLFLDNENLLAAVGESGGIYEINKAGEGVLIMKAEENHILCLEQSRTGEIIAGSGGKGLIYRITLGQKASILYESPYEEIKRIALDRAGNIYAAAGGKVTPSKKGAVSLLPSGVSTEITVTAAPETPSKKQPSVSLDKQPGALFLVNPEGLAKKLWSSEDELVYSLLWDEAARKIIFGTGDKGRLYEIDSEKNVSLLLQKDSEQVYLLVPHDSIIYSLFNNPARLIRISPGKRSEGEYESHVLDAGTLSQWGRVEWEAELTAGSAVQLFTRSGNSSQPDRTWSEWSPPYQKAEGEQILSPKGRYLQFKIKLRAELGRQSPSLKKVSLFYLQSNLPPSLTKLELFPANEVYLKPLEQDEIIWGENVSQNEKAMAKDKSKQSFMTPKKVQRKGYQTVIWDAEDENNDSLLYSIYIRREDESRWRIFEQSWVEKIFAFDTLNFPDGVYYLKIEASDSPSNPKELTLKSEKISRKLIIDNSLPVFKNVQIDKKGNSLDVVFSVEDTQSYIKDAKFLIRPNDWQDVFPEDGVCDSKTEMFRFSVSLTPDSDNLIVLKVKDSQDNVAVYRSSF
jgi:hypothetical protein